MKQDVNTFIAAKTAYQGRHLELTSKRDIWVPKGGKEGHKDTVMSGQISFQTFGETAVQRGSLEELKDA